MNIKAKLLSELEEGVFQRIEFLKNCKYFISKNGRILSLNSGEPKELPLRINAAQIATIVLYTPSLKKFNVASLILQVFRGRAENSEYVPEYINGDPGDLHLDNLKWGKTDNTINNETARAIEVASTLVKSRGDISQKESYVVNSALRNEILNALTQLLRLTIKESLEDNDKTGLIKFIDEITLIINTNIIVNESFHHSIPINLHNQDISKVLKELRKDVETNISLYRGARL